MFTLSKGDKTAELLTLISEGDQMAQCCCRRNFIGLGSIAANQCQVQLHAILKYFRYNGIGLFWCDEKWESDVTQS